MKAFLFFSLSVALLISNLSFAEANGPEVSALVPRLVAANVLTMIQKQSDVTTYAVTQGSFDYTQGGASSMPNTVQRLEFNHLTVFTGAETEDLVKAIKDSGLASLSEATSSGHSFYNVSANSCVLTEGLGSVSLICD